MKAVLKTFNEEELRALLKFANRLADQSQGVSFADTKTTEAHLAEAEEEARKYAQKRNNNKRHHSDYGASEIEKGISASVKDWIARRRKRGHRV